MSMYDDGDYEAYDPYEQFPVDHDADGYEGDPEPDADDFYPYDEDDAEADAWQSQYDDDPNPYHGNYYEDDGY
jgi:hypothetical protein